MIEKIQAREILDSRGNPTVEVELRTGNGQVKSSVPSGASTGKYEALELRDGGKRYTGKGVKKAVKNVNEKIENNIVGMDPMDQREIDNMLNELDGTDDKSGLGANAILAVSMAVCKAGALYSGKSLYQHIASIEGRDGDNIPCPQFNIVNGGKHAGMENDIQESMIVPLKIKTFHQALRAGSEIYHVLKNMIKEEYGALRTQVGDEGGFVLSEGIEKRLEIITKAIEECGWDNKVFLALDAASSEFFYDGVYKIGDEEYSSKELIGFYQTLCKKFDIISLEDGMAEDDWEGWARLTKELGNKIKIIGDDLLVTNPGRIKTAINKKACNALLLKVNQIGTVSEAMDANNLVNNEGWETVVSHRSGETMDTFISDLAVGLDAGFIKSGAPARGERVCKYNQLLRIEEQLNE